MSFKLYSVSFACMPFRAVPYLVDHPNGRTVQYVPLVDLVDLGDSDDVLSYEFAVSAPNPDVAVAKAKLLLIDSIRDDYHPDAGAAILFCSCRAIRADD